MLLDLLNVMNLLDNVSWDNLCLCFVLETLGLQIHFNGLWEIYMLSMHPNDINMDSSLTVMVMWKMSGVHCKQPPYLPKPFLTNT